MITKNEYLNNLLDGKRIVIVGPSPHLVDQNIGSTIDDYDVVCRVNDIIPVSELRKDYGKRTDILFHNCSTDGMPGLIEKIEHNKTHWENLKMVVCPSIKALGPQNDYLSWSNDYISDVVIFLFIGLVLKIIKLCGRLLVQNLIVEFFQSC